MKDEDRRKRFEEKYARFIMADIVIGFMEQEQLSVRAMARAMGVSPTVVQDLRSGKRKNLTLKHLLAFADACHAKITIEKGTQVFSLLG